MSLPSLIPKRLVLPLTWVRLVQVSTCPLCVSLLIERGRLSSIPAFCIVGIIESNLPFSMFVSLIAYSIGSTQTKQHPLALWSKDAVIIVCGIN